MFESQSKSKTVSNITKLCFSQTVMLDSLLTMLCFTFLTYTMRLMMHGYLVYVFYEDEMQYSV